MIHVTNTSRLTHAATATAILACVGHAAAFGGGSTTATTTEPVEATHLTPMETGDFVAAQSGWRLVDLDIERTSPLTWSGAGVEATGPYAGAWDYHGAITPSDLVQLTDDEGLMVVDIDFHYFEGQWHYMALLEPHNGDPSTGFGASHDVGTIPNYFNNPDRYVLDVQPYNEAGTTQYAISWRTASPEDQAKQQRFYPALTRAQILDKINNDGLRLTDIDTRPHDNLFDVVMELEDDVQDWWVHDATASELQEFIDQHGARVVDLESYGDPQNPTYDALLRPNTNELTQTVNAMMRSTTDGESGFNQTIGHVEQAAIRADAYFEPADSFSLFYLYAAFEEIEAGERSLGDIVGIRSGDGDPCPDNSGSLLLTTYEDALRRMMQNGDRQAAHSVLQMVGGTDIQGNLNDRSAIHSYLFHELGCYDGNVQNYTTLDDVDHLGRHYLLGWLHDETEHAMLDIMNNDLDTTLAGSVTFESVLDLALDQSDMTEWDKLRFRKYISLQTVAGTYDDYSDPDEGVNTSRFVLHKMPIKLSEPFFGHDVGLYFGTSNAFVNDASSVFGAEAAVGLAIARLWRNALDSVIPSWEDNPSPCPADQNADGVLDNGDISAFVENFLSSDESADVNFDGVFDHGDIFLFVHLFMNGCEL